MDILLYILFGMALMALLGFARSRTFDFMAQRPADYADATGPAFDLRTHLNGPLVCEGVIYGPTGRVSSRFVGKFDAQWDGNTAVMHEHFTYDSGAEQKRHWNLVLGNDGRIQATAPDVVGEGEGRQAGPSVRLRYRIRLPEDSGGHVLDTTDWMYLAPNGTIVNRSQFRKFGIKVAELVATMRRVECPRVRQWTGKTYWLVGASEGLGAALAERLSRAGVEVILTARSQDKLEALAERLPGPTRIEALDVTDAEALEAAAERIGEIDGVIQMAGVYWPFAAQDWNAEQANAMAEVNYTGAMKLMGVILPRFLERGSGHIVLTGSLSGYRGLPGAAPYVSSKAGVMALAEALYADLRKTDIQVQLVNPGFIKTRLTEKNSFSMPFIMEPEEAAEICFKHMSGSRFQRAFPRVFSLVFRGSQLLPDWLYFRLFA